VTGTAKNPHAEPSPRTAQEEAVAWRRYPLPPYKGNEPASRSPRGRCSNNAETRAGVTDWWVATDRISSCRILAFYHAIQ